jgi:hypothetical protein
VGVTDRVRTRTAGVDIGGSPQGEETGTQQGSPHQPGPARCDRHGGMRRTATRVSECLSPDRVIGLR